MLLLNTMLEVSVTSLTNTFKKLVSWWRKSNKNEDDMEISMRGVLLLVSIMFICSVAGTAGLFKCIEDWTYFEGIYFTIVSFTTVGLGDFVPFKEASQYNKYEVYHMLNLIVIIVGNIFTYIFLNLLATIYKSLIHYLASQSSLVEDKVTTPKRREANLSSAESRDVPRRKIGISRFSSISSSTNGAVESNPMGSFAAIQRAIDRIRSKAVEDNTARTNELKAVNTIEAILQNEYEKIQARQGDGPKARWHRAAAKARLSNRRKNSVYNSVILDTASIQNGCPNLESIITKRSLQHKSLSSLSSKRVPDKSFSNLSSKSLQDTFTNHDAFSTNKNPQIHPAFNIQSFRESKTKLSITHENIEDRELSYQNVLKKRIKETVSRQSTKSTYLPPEFDDLQHHHPNDHRSHHLSPNESRENTPGSRRRVEHTAENEVYNQNTGFSSNNNNNTEGFDATLTYEKILECREKRRRRSTKSTYLSSNNKSRRSSMELDDLHSSALGQHRHHNNDEMDGIGNSAASANNHEMGKGQQGLYFKCPLTVDLPYYDDDEADLRDRHNAECDNINVYDDDLSTESGDERSVNAQYPPHSPLLTRHERMIKTQLYQSYGKNIIGNLV